jgi:hypothetical protein
MRPGRRHGMIRAAAATIVMMTFLALLWNSKAQIRVVYEFQERFKLDGEAALEKR